MKKLLLSALSVLALGAAQAQLRYTFSTQTGQAYTPLTGATDLTAGTQWDDDGYTAPIGFTFRLDSQAINQAFIGTETSETIIGLMNTGAFDTVTGIVPLDADLWDRGNAGIDTDGLSPIRYSTTGTAPSRIFKVEFFNAGFYDDFDDVDSTNFQVWMYEGTNVVELRYGPSKVTPANYGDYFMNSSGPRVGFASDVVLSLVPTGKFYYLRGSTSAPTLDSVTLPTPPANALTGYPASGTVYRFTPTVTGGTSIAEAVAAARALKLYPTVATSSISVVWTGKAGEAYDIVSAKGQRVASGTLQAGTQSISIDGLAAGTYFLKLAAGTHQFSKQ